MDGGICRGGTNSGCPVTRLRSDGRLTGAVRPQFRVKVNLARSVESIMRFKAGKATVRPTKTGASSLAGKELGVNPRSRPTSVGSEALSQRVSKAFQAASKKTGAFRSR